MNWPAGHYGCYHCGHDQTDHNNNVGCPHCKCAANPSEAGTDPTGKYADTAVLPPGTYLHDWQDPTPPTIDASSRINYVLYAEAWYARPELDQVLRIGRDLYTADGHDNGCVWEFQIELHHLGGTQTALRLQMFDDSWVALAELPHLFARLATMSNHEVGPRRTWAIGNVVEVLNEFGFTDDTPRHQDQCRITRWSKLAGTEGIATPACTCAARNRR